MQSLYTVKYENFYRKTQTKIVGSFSSLDAASKCASYIMFGDAEDLVIDRPKWQADHPSPGISESIISRWKGGPYTLTIERSIFYSSIEQWHTKAKVSFNLDRLLLKNMEVAFVSEQNWLDVILPLNPLQQQPIDDFETMD